MNSFHSQMEAKVHKIVSTNETTQKIKNKKEETF